MSKSERMFDKSSYSATTISVYQLIGAYFVDIYYNHLYAEAIKFKSEGKVVSVTEGYRHATFAFLSALDPKSKKTYKADNYTKLLQGINEYFIQWTSFNSLTLSECIDKIVREFVPKDYHKTLDKDQKRNVLRNVLIKSVRQFTKTVVTVYLSSIIDNHDDSANVNALMETIINIFIGERESMFHQFLDCGSGNDSDPVDRKFAEKMRNEINRLIEERNGMVDDRKRMLTAIAELESQVALRNEQISKAIAGFRALEKSHKSLVAEYAASRQKIVELENASKQSRQQFERPPQIENVSKQSRQQFERQQFERQQQQVENASKQPRQIERQQQQSAKLDDLSIELDEDNDEDQTDSNDDNDDKPVLTKPNDNPVSLDKPSSITEFDTDEQVVNKTPVEKPVDNKPPVDKTPVDKKPADNKKPVDNKTPVDKTPVDKKPADNKKPVDNKTPVDKTPVNNKKPPVKLEDENNDNELPSNDVMEAKLKKYTKPIKNDLGLASKLNDIY